MSTLTLQLFGAFALSREGQLLPSTRTRKEQRLLALLTLRAPQPVERSWLAGVMWPDSVDDQARENLRHSLSNLRSILGPDASRLVSETSRTLRFEVTGMQCDVLAFDVAFANGGPVGLEAAVALYRGPLLEECYEEWILPERQRRAQEYCSALESLADQARKTGDFEKAISWLRRLLAAEPLRESAVRHLMQSLAQQGDQAALTQVYRDFRLLLHDELNAPPDAETTALYHLLRTESREKSRPRPRPVVPSVASLSHLPVSPTPFIGREAEREQLRALLETTRLLTLTGTGGVGKTRLAIAVAEENAEEYREGIYFVDLAPLKDPGRVVQAVALALKVREEPNRPLLKTLLDHLQARSLLLILDNCEHLLSGCASLAEALLAHCPHLRVLATSRQPLRAAEERTWHVPSLTLPEGRKQGAQAILMESEAAQLFVECATSAYPAFRLTQDNLDSVIDICRLLDGIPLALELAAAWVRMMPVSQVVARLRDRLDMLQSQHPGRLPRHETLRATLDWSYGLLEPREQRLLRRLSVFAGGWSLEAAEAVCAEEAKAPEGVLLGLARLVDNSLVAYVEQRGVGRYRLLETTRQYAREKLVTTGEEEEGCTRHCDWFLALAEEVWTKRYSVEAPMQMDLLEREHDNCREALDFCASGSDAESHLRFAGAMSQLWEWRGYYREGRGRLTAALSRPDAQEFTFQRARALNAGAILAMVQNDSEAARSLYTQSGEIARALGEKRMLAIVLNNLGVLERQELRYDLAQALFDESLALMRELNDRAGMALALVNIGRLAKMQNDPVRARPPLEESAALSREAGNLYVLEGALSDLAQVAMQEGDYATARTQYREALALLAASRYEENLVEVLETVAELAARLQRPHHAVRVFAAVAAMRERVGLSVRPFERADHDRREQLLRTALDEKTFALEWTAGLTLTTEQVLALAVEETREA